VTVLLAVADDPRPSLAVSVTSKLAEEPNTLVTVPPDALVPSPKFQLNVRESPSGSEPDAVKDMFVTPVIA